MALPTNTFRSLRYYRSKFREGKYLLAAEATDLQLESFEQLREYIKNTYGDICVGPAWKVEKPSSNSIVLRPGEAWLDGVPFILKSGTDPLVVVGIVPTNTDTSQFDLSSTTIDSGGKKLIFPPSVANDNYSVVIEAEEELVREAGSSGAVDPFLEGVNVGEGTEHKLRLIYKVHVIETVDLTSSPTFPLAGINNLVNEIIITPSIGSGDIQSATDVTPDINGADRTVVFNNLSFKLPFANDSADYVFGKLVDSDGNIFVITSISTSDGGNHVQMRIDREVKVASVDPRANLPVITLGVPFRLIKRDHYVTDSNSIPQGQRFLRVADFTFTSPNVGTITDTRTVSNINTFGIDPNVRMREGGLVSWSTTSNQLTNNSDFVISVPGLAGKARIAPGVITLTNEGDVAYFLLNRSAISDYFVVPTVVTKTSVPSNVDVYIMAERGSQRVHFPHNGSIGDSETGFLGGFGSELAKDLSRDNLTDMLTEVEMDEVFAETFDVDDDVDFVKTQSLTFEPFNKLFRATSNARFVDFFGNTVPESDPINPWTKIGTQTSSSSAGIVTLIDSSGGDLIRYERTESSLTPLTHSHHKFRARLTAGSGTYPFIYELHDGVGGKRFGLVIDTTSVKLVDGGVSTLQSFLLDTTIFHQYELVKIGNTTIQWYVDGVLRGSFPYEDIVTGSGGVSRVSWGTNGSETATVDVDYIIFNIYTSIFYSKDLFRKGSVFYEADALPDVATPVWVKTDGGGGITEVITDGNLVITDNISTNRIFYKRDDAFVRHGDAEVEIRIKVASVGIVALDRLGVRFEDGSKEIAIYLRDVAGQLKVGLFNAASGTNVGPLHNLDYDKFYSLKLRKVKDENVQLLVDNVLLEMHTYDEFTDLSLDTRVLFGSFLTTSQYVATIDFVQYALPGFGELAGTPVRDFLSVVNTNDPSPIAWVSSDNGKTWFKTDDRDAISVSDTQLTGANLFIQIGLSQINSELTDYGVYYNKTGFETDGPFRYTVLTAIGGQTVFELPFVYTTGVNELIVTYKPVAGDSRELFVGDDYIENDSNHITTNFALSAGDKLKFRVIFVTSPIVVPTGGVFIGHDHDGSGGESDVLNPSEVNTTGDINVGGDLNVTGFINGTSPLKLDSLDDGVTVGSGLLNAGTLPLTLQTLLGANPAFRLVRGAHQWDFTGNSGGEVEFLYNGTPRFRVSSLGLTNFLGGSIQGIGAIDSASANIILAAASSHITGSSSGSFSSGGTGVVTNLSVNITTHGRPVVVFLRPGNSGASQGYVSASGAGTRLRFRRDAGTSMGVFTMVAPTAFPCSIFKEFDVPPAGNHTYDFNIETNSGTVFVENCRLTVYEI